MNALTGLLVGSEKEIGSRGSTSIDILREETHKLLKKEAAATGRGMRILANDILEMYFEKKEYLKKTIPSVEKITIKEGILYVYDKNKRITALVGLKKGTIFCEFCKSNECIHAFFANSLPESSRLEPLRPT